MSSKIISVCALFLENWSKGCCFYMSSLQMAAVMLICCQNGCSMEVMQISPCAQSTVTFSSLPPCLLIQHPVASHHHHPPSAPYSPQPGCSYGNSRIHSGPVSAVSVSSVSLLSLFSSVQSDPHSRLLAAAYFSFEELVCYCSLLFLPRCRMKGGKKDAYA